LKDPAPKAGSFLFPAFCWERVALHIGRQPEIGYMSLFKIYNTEDADQADWNMDLEQML
jgi:hypothetical protein